MADPRQVGVNIGNSEVRAGPCEESLPHMESQNRDEDTVEESLPQREPWEREQSESGGEIPQLSEREELQEVSNLDTFRGEEPGESLPQVSGEDRCGL